MKTITKFFLASCVLAIDVSGAGAQGSFMFLPKTETAQPPPTVSPEPSGPVPPAPETAAPSPSIAETINFLTEIVPKAASLDRVPRLSGKRESTYTVAVGLSISEIGDRGFYFRFDWQSSGAFPEYYNFNLKDVVILKGTSGTLTTRDKQYYLTGIGFSCKIGSCIEHFNQWGRESKVRKFDLMFEKEETRNRIAKAIKHLSAQIKLEEDPF